MRKNCVMNTLLFRGVMLLVFLLGVEVGGVAQEDNQDVTVGDVRIRLEARVSWVILHSS